MKSKSVLFVVAISALLLTLLFYRQYLGLNLVIFEVVFLAWLFFSNQLELRNKNIAFYTTAFLLSSLITVITHSTFSYLIHFVALFAFVGVLNYSKVRSLVSAFGISLLALFQTPLLYFNELFGQKIKGNKLGGILWKSRIFIFPLLIIFVFLSIYSFSNPLFGDMVSSIALRFEKSFLFLFEGFDFLLVVTFLVSLFASIFLLVRTAHSGIVEDDAAASEELKRIKVRRNRSFKLPSLKSELKAGVFLLLALNLLLLILNVLDVYWVWLNFEWGGETLKEFVHEGTYLLLFSVLISIALVLYFFRGNLNFYSKNKFIKTLAYLWLFQNAILVISVAIRNIQYIEHFNLAYRRIGVFIFLALTLYGLYTVLRKIQFKKSSFYLFKMNAMAVFVVLLLTSTINWDATIAKHNFQHADESYLHLAYLSNLSDKALPHLDKSYDELVALSSFQNKKFSYYSPLEPETYRKKIALRKERFKSKWESTNFLSWNLPEHLAYWQMFEREADSRR